MICDVTEAMPINGLGAHKPCPLALDCMKACNTARAAKGGLRERSGAKGGEGGEGRGERIFEHGPCVCVCYRDWAH